jgi:hypothetical protein
MEETNTISKTILGNIFLNIGSWLYIAGGEWIVFTEGINVIFNRNANLEKFNGKEATDNFINN